MDLTDNDNKNLFLLNQKFIQSNLISRTCIKEGKQGDEQEGICQAGRNNKKAAL